VVVATRIALAVIMTKPKHPSGRPRHDTPFRNLSITRAPRDEPLTPGLRQRGLAQAIGFHHTGPSDDEIFYDECRKRRRP
jgi:hypothetical protein